MAKDAPKYPKRSEAQKQVVGNRVRNEQGRFTKSAVPSNIPPQSTLQPQSLFVSKPNPVSGIYYDNDPAHRTDPENASRMLYDPTISSSLQESYLSTALLPYQIVPEDENDSEQKEAAEEIHKIVDRIPYLCEYFRCLLEAKWYGRSAIFNNYEWDFSDQLKQRFVVKSWYPINGDSLLFNNEGLAAIKVGIDADPDKTIVTVNGRAQRITERERPCIVVHHYQRTGGEWRDPWSAAAQFGLSLRQRIYPCWLYKQECWVSLANQTEKFRSGFLIYYFQIGNQTSEQAMYNAAIKQQGSTTLLIPRSDGDSAAEGVEVINPPDGARDLLDQIEKIDTYIRLAICGEELTAKSGPTGLGSNLADVHQDTMNKYIKYDSLALQETITRELITVLQEWNGYGHLPPLKFEFSFDKNGEGETLEKAKALDEMGIPLSETEVRQEAGLTKPLSTDDKTDDKTDEQTDDVMNDKSPKTPSQSARRNTPNTPKTPKTPSQSARRNTPNTPKTPENNER